MDPDSDGPKFDGQGRAASSGAESVSAGSGLAGSRLAGSEFAATEFAGAEFDALIRRADADDRDAADTLFAMLYGELHRLAEQTLRRAGGGGSSGGGSGGSGGSGGAVTLGPTTLLHEAYLNVTRRDDVAFADRARFLAYASRAMRGLVVDYARRRQAKKRGGDLQITLAGSEPASDDAVQHGRQLELLGDALDELAGIEPALAQLVDLHFFCGFTFAEIAALRTVSERTVQRDWRKARLLLHRTLHDDGDEPAGAARRQAGATLAPD